MLGVITGRGRIFVKALRQWEKCVFLHRQRFSNEQPLNTRSGDAAMQLLPSRLRNKVL